MTREPYQMTLATQKFHRFQGPRGHCYTALAVAKLGLFVHAPWSTFHLVGAAVASRLLRKMSIACAIEAIAFDRQLSDTRCSRSSLFET